MDELPEFARGAIRPDGGTLFGINGGIQYLLAPQLEIDAELGASLRTWSAGITWGLD